MIADMPALAIKAAGMVTALGFNAPATCAAIRAGIRNVNETNLWDAESGDYLAAGRVSLPHWWVGLGKLADLVAPAIQECLAAAQPVSASSIPILLGVPPLDRPFRFPDLDTQLLGELEQRLEIRLQSASRVIPRDRVSVVAALREATSLVADKKAPCVVVAAVDSLVQQNVVQHFLNKRRILTAKNSNGFTVGEAGSALLVGPSGRDSHDELEVLGTGMAHEEALIDSEEPLKANGLTMAIRDSLREAGLTIQDAEYRITDLNGEHYKFKEMSLAMIRFERNPRPKLFDLWHPLEGIGDVGAAAGPLVLGLALHASQKGYAVGRTVLCTFSNDDGERAAVLARYCTRKE